MTENGSGRNRGARRCLFPPGQDSDRDSQDLESLLKREEETAAKSFENRWNFDIRNETPNPGRYEWEKIGNGSSKPSATLSRLSSLEAESTQKTKTMGNKESPIDDKVSIGEAEIQPTTGGAGDGSKSSQENDVNKNTAPSTIKRKAAKIQEEGDANAAKRCKPP